MLAGEQPGVTQLSDGFIGPWVDNFRAVDQQRLPQDRVDFRTAEAGKRREIRDRRQNGLKLCLDCIRIPCRSLMRFIDPDSKNPEGTLRL